jgi:hypothetical protein
MLVGDDIVNGFARAGRGVDVPAWALEASTYLGGSITQSPALVTLRYRLYPDTVGLLLETITNLELKPKLVR